MPDIDSKISYKVSKAASLLGYDVLQFVRVLVAKEERLSLYYAFSETGTDGAREVPLEQLKKCLKSGVFSVSMKVENMEFPDPPDTFEPFKVDEKNFTSHLGDLLVSGQAVQRLYDDFNHSEDFAVVRLNHEEIPLTKNQSAYIEALYLAYKKGEPPLSESDLMNRFEPGMGTIKDAFKGHKARLDKLIEVKNQRAQAIYRIRLTQPYC